jgi:hypothetical protein
MLHTRVQYVAEATVEPQSLDRSRWIASEQQLVVDAVHAPVRWIICEWTAAGADGGYQPREDVVGDFLKRDDIGAAMSGEPARQ